MNTRHTILFGVVAGVVAALAAVGLNNYVRRWDNTHGLIQVPFGSQGGR